MKKNKHSKFGLGFGIALSVVLTGCVVAPPQRVVYAEPPPVYVETVVVPGGYVYYPGYQVYYSGSTRQYIYLQGSAWVTRPAPPRVSVDVLFASPSVPLDFHDAPAAHHASVVRQYPKHWAPSEAKSNHGHGQGNHKND